MFDELPAGAEALELMGKEPEGPPGEVVGAEVEPAEGVAEWLLLEVGPADVD